MQRAGDPHCMKLNTVHFDAFRSLLAVNLDLSSTCMGLVGINESGKSNVLQAIAMLAATEELAASDMPKMGERPQPKIRFEFEFSESEQKRITEILANWGMDSADAEAHAKGFRVIYTVEQDKRTFDVRGGNLKAGVYVRRASAHTEKYVVQLVSGARQLAEVGFVTEAELLIDDQSRKRAAELRQLEGRIDELDAEFGDASPDVENPPSEWVELQTLRRQSDKLKSLLSKFPINDLLAAAEEQKAAAAERTSNVRADLEALENASENDAKASLRLRRRLKQSEENELSAQRTIDSLEESLRDKFSTDADDLNELIAQQLDESWLPSVVFWTHESSYILKAEYRFAELEKADTEEGISRPLMNLFRIGLEVETLEELQKEVKEIRADSYERSRYERRMNDRLRRYLNSVWPEFGQELGVHLEENKIRIQVHDPKAEDAAYFPMSDRSQGCQTFISFLLTIGAEAKKGVIQDTILLLDEPETHLHPSGVRFMLKELISTAKNGNQVIFSTHSMFMIDRDDFNRYAIVTKQHERTSIMPSLSGRTGLFMQEEVLYSALDIDFSSKVQRTSILSLKELATPHCFKPFMKKRSSMSAVPTSTTEVSVATSCGT